MRSVMNAQQMREVDKYMIETLQIPSLVLMENAAMGTARLVMEKKKDPCVVHVFCGTGNNGGDGLACARILLARGYDAYVAIVGSPQNLTEDAAANYAFFEHFPDRILSVSSIEDLYGWRVPKADVIVDAIFGVGLSREVLGVHADVIASINSTQATRISVDIPSGVDADTGRILGTAVHADATATFQYPKVGHFLYPGREYTGQLRVVPIGIDKGVEDVVASRMVAYESDDPDVLIPLRNPDSNKGTYGRLLLLAGSRGMAGAAVMCARSAYAAGAGLVAVGAPWAVVDVMQNAVPEATCVLLPEEEGRLFSGSANAVEYAAEGKTAMVVGPGLGSGKGLKTLVSEILTTYQICRVVDADALNALDKDLKVLAHVRGDVVFTPHPLEFARLLGTELRSVQDHPLELATAFAQKCRVTLVLKGATTIVAGPDGDISLIAAGSPGMAKGGSGDVLAGVIGGFAAQGVPGYDAAVLGAYLCAMAGERAATLHGEYSSSPMDTIEELGGVMELCLSPDAPAWNVPIVRDERMDAPAPPTFHPQEMPQKVVRTSAQRTAPESPAQTIQPAPSAAPEAAAASGGPTLDAEPEPSVRTAEETSSVRDALHAVSAKRDDAAPISAAAAVGAHRLEPEQSAAQATHQEHPDTPTAENHAPETGFGASHKPHGARMSATDVRPPKLPRPMSPTNEPTKVVEPLEDTLAAGKKEDDSHNGSHHHRRSEKRRSEKRGRKLTDTAEAVQSEATAEEPVDAAAEDRKREHLNDQIQMELSKNKAQGRTRRRIG